MGSFGHDPAPVSEPENVAVSARNARYGLILFLLYCILFGGFVVLNAFSAATMAINIAGVNLAIWYGLLLILSAMVMAIIYTVLCARKLDGHE